MNILEVAHYCPATAYVRENGRLPHNLLHNVPNIGYIRGAARSTRRAHFQAPMAVAPVLLANVVEVETAMLHQMDAVN